MAQSAAGEKFLLLTHVTQQLTYLKRGKLILTINQINKTVLKKKNLRSEENRNNLALNLLYVHRLFVARTKN